MSTAAQRLRQAREQKGFASGAELARKSGIPEATYRAYESERRALTPRAAKQLAAVLGCTWQWLLFGKEEGVPATVEEAAAELGLRADHRPPVVPRHHAAEIVDVAGESLALLPLYDAHASAGPGTFQESQDILYRVPFRADFVRRLTHSNIDRLALVLVDGDSMEPTLRQGDQVLVDFAQNRPTKKDGIYVLVSDDGLQVKRIQSHFATRRISILSDNSAYEPQRDVDPDSIVVVGRVIWIGRQVGS